MFKEDKQDISRIIVTYKILSNLVKRLKRAYLKLEVSVEMDMPGTFLFRCAGRKNALIPGPQRAPFGLQRFIIPAVPHKAVADVSKIGHCAWMAERIH
jgi:hypothetical protein